MSVMGSFLIYVYALLVGLTVAGLPQPFSLPPRPEDQALMRMAPADCIAAYVWFGAAAADAQAANRTERLAADPEIRDTVARLWRATRSAIEQELGAAGTGVRAAVDLAADALQCPGMVFVRAAAPGTAAPVEAGLALQLGEARGRGRALLDLLALALRAKQHGELHDDTEVDGVRFHALPTDVDRPFFGWAEVDGWLLVAFGDGVPAALVHGLRNTDAGLGGRADVARLLQAAAIGRPATRTWVDTQGLWKLLRERDGEQNAAILAALGLDQATSALAQTGLDGDGFAVRVELDVRQPTGLLGACAGAAVTQDALMPVPADADVALALRADPDRLERALLACAGALFGGDAEGEYATMQQEFEHATGVTLRKDLLQCLDGQFTAWNAPSQGGIGCTAATGTLGLRDGKTFAQAWRTLLARAGDDMPRKASRLPDRGEIGDRNFLEEETALGRTMHWFELGRYAPPFAPALALTDGALVAGLMPAPVRATLAAIGEPNPDRSLARRPEVNRRGSATAMLYVDARALVASTWPLLMLGFQRTAQEWQRDGFDFDAADLPRLDALLRHLGSELTFAGPRTGGFQLRRSGTLPVFDPLTIATAAAIAAAIAD